MSAGPPSSAPRCAREEELPEVRTITAAPRHHWFGYYDKLEFDPTGRYVLAMEVDFEHRSPRPDDVIRIGMVDIEDGDRWIELGRSAAWCWQQGCMLQWLPRSATKVLWNDREGASYVCRIRDVKTGELRTIAHPVYALSPDGKTAISTDFRRLGDVRPGYGYVGIPDPYADDPTPRETGVFRVSLETGEQELILPVADVARFGQPLPSMQGAKHYFNHLLFNPDGSRFVFLHRWRLANGSRETRMITAAPDGSDLRILDDNGLTSHFIWRDPKHILAWSRQPSHGQAFYLFADGGEGIEIVGAGIMTEDGHCSYLPGSEWILADTYPHQGGAPPADRLQHPYLYHVKTGRRVALGHFHSPPEYTGEWRCDLHPRSSPDGRLVVIDSPHTGGRQVHLIGIGGIIGCSPKGGRP